MKRKNTLSENATKGDLVILKQELKQEMRGLKKEIDEKAQSYRDQILSKLDETMGELGTMREENIIGSGQTSQLRDNVEDHEKRIKHLEKAQPTA